VSGSSRTRRDFLTGKAALETVRDGIHLPELTPEAPTGGDTVRLTTWAMACEFSVIMNAGATENVMHASRALDVVHELEQQMSVYRPDSELSRLNQRAGHERVDVEPQLFALLLQAKRLGEMTAGGFDPTSGPLVGLWRACRARGRIPHQDEIDRCLEIVGIDHVLFEEASESVRYDREGVELNLGGIGKGHALDRVAELLVERESDAWLLHGGHSSLLARGNHNALDGWPVGIGNPLFTDQRLGTIVLRNCAMSTSGSNIQHFRHQGRRYGHILDPRSGWPVDGMLSVTVLAPTAAVADALSTAFFVVGVEKTRACCDNLEGLGAILIPFPETGRRVCPVVLGIPEDIIFWNEAQVAV